METRKKYREEHKKEMKEYRERNKEKIQSQIREWHEDNIEYVREKNRIYAREHPEEAKERSRKFRLVHKEELVWKAKEYRQSEKGKEIHKKSNAERRGNLGFVPLNKPIKGIKCDAHHVNRDDIVYIPHVIHSAIHHNLKTGKNMKVINSIAYSFL